MSSKIKAVQTYDTVKSSDSITRPSNTTAYTAGDVISDVTTNDHFTFNGVTDGTTNTGTIMSLRINSSANVATKPDLELWLFHTDVAEVADNGAFAPTDGEMLTVVGVIDIPLANFLVGIATVGAAGNTVQVINDINMPFVTTKAANDTAEKRGVLYGQLVHRASYTPVSAEVFTVELTIARD